MKEKNFERKKSLKLLGKKRKLINYKNHSLIYNELGNIIKEQNINLNINTINQYTKINENIIKGDFIGSFPNGDLLLEGNCPNNGLKLQYTIYNKKFKSKINFVEDRGGKFFLIGRNYGGYFNNSYIRIYLFLNDNTEYKIIQKIFFHENFPHDIIFPFSFIHNNNLYFFLKYFTYDKINLTIYKLKEEKDANDNNNEAANEKLFEEDETLALDFVFIWFAQKNNDEFLFFMEENDIFDLIVYNFEEKKIINKKKFNLIKLDNPHVANYVNKVIYEKYLIYTNENLLFIIDVDLMEIISIIQLFNIQYIHISDDNIIWTVEYKCKYEYTNNNKRKKCQYHYLKEYFLNKNNLELIKIGERPMTNHFVNNFFQLDKEKILLFIEKKKIELLSINK